jgi:hypothetical protein
MLYGGAVLLEGVVLWLLVTGVAGWVVALAAGLGVRSPSGRRLGVRSPYRRVTLRASGPRDEHHSIEETLALDAQLVAARCPDQGLRGTVAPPVSGRCGEM